MTQEWIQVAKVDDVPDDGTLLVDCEGEPVCLYRVADGVFATHDTCSHGMASLADGFIIDGKEIECPLHQGTFDIRTGKAVGIPCKVDVRSYPVKVENGVIFVKEA